MTWIDLGNPSPREVAIRYEPYLWQNCQTEFLDTPNDIPEISLSHILDRRRSSRTFGPVPWATIHNFLWLTSRQVLVGHDALGFELSKRPTPSAGAIHPVHILLSNETPEWKRYIPAKHAFAQVKESISLDIRDAIARLMAPEHATILMLVAEPGKTSAKYDNPNSLIWRDAGAILGVMAIVAEFLNLNFCPLGITGEPWAQKLDKQSRLVGVGVALLGAR